jgi:ribonuclease HI
MKPVFHLFIGLWLLLLSANVLAQTSQSTENSGSLVQVLMEKSNEMQSLRKSKDVNGIKLLLTDDFDYVGGDGRLHHRDELLGDMQDGTLREFKLYEPQAVQIDSSAALLTYNAILDMREGDDPGMAPRYQKVSDLWVKQGSEWRLRFEQATPVRPID